MTKNRNSAYRTMEKQHKRRNAENNNTLNMPSTDKFNSQISLKSGGRSTTDVTGFFQPSTDLPLGKIGLHLPQNRDENEPTLADQFQAVKTQISNLNDQISQQSTQITRLNSKVSQQSTQITRLNSKVSHLSLDKLANQVVQLERAVEEQITFEVAPHLFDEPNNYYPKFHDLKAICDRTGDDFINNDKVTNYSFYVANTTAFQTVKRCRNAFTHPDTIDLHIIQSTIDSIDIFDLTMKECILFLSCESVFEDIYNFYYSLVNAYNIRTGEFED